MSIKSDNPDHEVYIDGFPILGNFIPYNTGVERANTINQITDELTTGKDYTKYLGEKSEVLSFKTVLTDQLAKSGYENAIKSVVAKAKKEPVKIRFNGKSFMGMVREFSISFPVLAYREYTFLIVESEPFKAVNKTFNTYNYKKATTPVKTTGLNLPASLTTLLNCNPVYNCAKRGLSCVIAWQRQLRTDGYYTRWPVDGQFCTWTRSETIKWQKKYGVSATGKVDKATKLKLVERYLNTTKYSAADKKKFLQDYSKKL
jgi:hypothetical protein